MIGLHHNPLHYKYEKYGKREGKGEGRERRGEKGGGRERRGEKRGGEEGREGE